MTTPPPSRSTRLGHGKLLELPNSPIEAVALSADSSETGSTSVERRENSLRRLFSLVGVVPLGVFMVVYLWTTANAMRGREAFESAREAWTGHPFAWLVVLCGCCHAGLLNTLAHVQSTFRQPIIAVIGGTHLVSPTDEQMHHIVQALRGYGSPRLYPNHCTGRPVQLALAAAFGEHVAPCVAGTELVFEGAA